MALIVCISKAVVGNPLKAVCETLVFENEDQGRQYAKDNATFVFSVQKARLVENGKTEAEV